MLLEFYKVDLNVPETEQKKIIGLAKTRWVERYKAYDTYHLLYKATVFISESTEKINYIMSFANIRGKV